MFFFHIAKVRFFPETAKFSDLKGGGGCFSERMHLNPIHTL